MKTSSLLLVFSALVMACGGDDTGVDSGADSGGNDSSSSNDAAKDASSGDSSTTDSSPSDSGNPGDASFGDGGLGVGSPCDPQDNLCLPTLLCCSEPTHNFDGGPLSSYKCETPFNGVCPLQP